MLHLPPQSRNVAVLIHTAILAISATGSGCTPVTPPVPESHAFVLDVPEVTPLPQTASTQRQGGISITVASTRFDTKDSVECKYDFPRLALFETPPAGVSVKTHQEFAESSREVITVSPASLTFLVTIRNGMARVFRGAGAVVQFTVDNHMEAVGQENYTEFLSALLPPSNESQLRIAGPGIGTLRDGSTVGLFLYDVVTAIDAAGNVTKRENFEWYFHVARRHVTVIPKATYRNVWVPGEEVARIARLLPNNTQQLVATNTRCMPGVVAARGAGPRADELGSVSATPSGAPSPTAAPPTSVAPPSTPPPSAAADPRIPTHPPGGSADSVAALDAQVRSHPYRPDFALSLVRSYLRDSAYVRALPLARRLVADEPLSAEGYRALVTAFRSESGEHGPSAAASSSALSVRARSDSAKKYETLLGNLTGEAAVTGFNPGANSVECTVSITNRTTRPRSFTLIVSYLNRRGSIAAVDTLRAVDLAAGSARSLRSSRRASGVVGYRYRAP